ncbi:MlaD family protein [Conexibacter sp. DBS9H8]|uniref:MlaD family protein n=1 Tax=Conexibacter sp. DBS9H8 TaxID=2937801 RepID=UPI00200D25AB|nr:MlaD family protein [Conexibacter sp. DBS9H8]
MDTLAPRRSRVALMLAFTLSCVGLLIFLWIAFGGALPLAPAGYDLTAEFPQATELGVQDDVEIAGVTVGKVIAVSPDRRTGLTRAVLQIDHQYAPRPADTRAILRAKSLLGETYVALSPGDPHGPMLPDGGAIPAAQVAPTVSFAQILNTFGPRTRAAFETWMQDGGLALTGRGEDFNAAIAQLTPFGSHVGAVLAVLARDGTATRTLLAQGTVVLDALSHSPARLAGLITNADTVFASTARRAAALGAAVTAFPAFLRTAAVAVARLQRFSVETGPLVGTLTTAAPAFASALARLQAIAPGLDSALGELGPVSARSRAGVPALQGVLRGAVPLLARATPYLGTVVPIVDEINAYRRELAAAIANGAASTEATSPSLTSSRLVHYLRISAPVNPEALTAFPARPSSNRTNPYMAPGGETALLTGLASFAGYLCTSTPLPSIGAGVPASLAKVLLSVYYTDNPSGPACRAQAPLALSMTFPHLHPLP